MNWDVGETIDDRPCDGAKAVVTPIEAAANAAITTLPLAMVLVELYGRKVDDL